MLVIELLLVRVSWLLPDVSLGSVSVAGRTLTGEEGLAGVLSVTGVQWVQCQH